MNEGPLLDCPDCDKLNELRHLDDWDLCEKCSQMHGEPQGIKIRFIDDGIPGRIELWKNGKFVSYVVSEEE